MLFSQGVKATELSKPVRTWFSEGVGAALLEAEQHVIDRLLPTLYGNRLVQLGVLPDRDLALGSRAQWRVLVYPELVLGMGSQSVVAQGHELPLEPGSVDIILLHHGLDFSAHPHQVLKEAAAALRPGGHLLVVGFNPFSFWGLDRLWTRPRKAPVWQQANFISHHRLADWIRILDLTEVVTLSDFYHLPISDSCRGCLGLFERGMRRFTPRLGAFYATLIRKEVCGMTPVHQKRFAPGFFHLPLAKPATREHVCESR